MRVPAARAALLVVAFLLAATGLLAPGVQAANAGNCSFPVTTVDATGASVSVDAEPAEVVTLAPSAAQTMWEIGAEGKVTGVSTNADYLSGTSGLTTISTYPAVDAEIVVDLDPDLVLAPNTVTDEDVERLRALGLTVYKFEAANDVEDVYAKTERTGELVGACDGASDSVAEMKAKIETVRDAVGEREPRPVFYHMGGGWTAGSDTFIHEIITTAGGENVGATAGIGFYGVISPEVLVSEDPTWFVRGSVPVPNEAPYSQTTAGREGNVIVVNTDYMNQPAPRIVYPIETIAEALHPGVDIDLSKGGGVDADLTREGPTVEPRVAADGSLAVAVEGLYADRSVSLELPDDAGPNAGDGVDLRSVGLTLREPNPSFLVTVANASAAPPGERFASLTRFAIEGNGLWPDEIQRTRLRFHVPASTLAGADLAAGDLRLYRHDGTGWGRLDTRIVERPNGTVEVTADAATIGTFALVGEAGADGGPTTPTTTSTATGTTHTSTADGSATASVGGTTTPTSTDAAPTATAAPGQPGFGVRIAGLVVLAAAGLARRRGSP